MLMMTGFLFSFIFHPSLLKIVRAAVPGQVVMNEVAWAGSTDSSTDEWIELYNNSDQSVNVTNWHISDDQGASDYVIVSGNIAAHGYFLIEDHESAVLNVTADAIIDLSLANTGDSLQLYDSAGQLIDTVNGSGVAWYAGNGTSHATMERIDPVSTLDAASNWVTSTGAGAQSSGGSAIVGTPKFLNSQTTGQGGGSQQGATVDFVPTSPALHVGDVVTLTAKVQNVQDLFVYGFELTYDPALLHYKGAGEKTFLSESGAVPTSFQANLQNGQDGTLLVAGARMIEPKTGVDGNGDLFELQFDVLAAGATTINAITNSFLASPSADILAQFNDSSLTIQALQLQPVTNLMAVPGSQRYSVQLSWTVSAGAEKYRVYRKDAHGQIKQLAEVAQTNFLDGDGVTNGGFIIPETNYVYQVTALQGTTETTFVEVVGRDARGLKGDNTRSDRVDGRDLEGLAKHFAEQDTDSGFAPLVDTTYDGRIDGSDLIDFGANFARTYQP